MQPQARSELRHTGIEFLDRVPWGTHMCGFYESEQDHMQMVMAFLSAGAAANEYCLWITNTDSRALDKAPGQQVEIAPYSEWCLTGGHQPEALLEKWRHKVTILLKEGYTGLRVVHCTADVFPWDRDTILAQEAVLDQLLEDQPAIVLCPYPLQACSLAEIIALSNSHTFTFFRGTSTHNGALSTLNRYNVLRTLTAEVVHEIRNPITAIRALMELLHSKPEFNLYGDIIDKVIDEVDRVDMLARQFLCLAKTFAPTSSTGCNLNSVIDAVRPLLEAAAAKRHQWVHIELSPVPDVPCKPAEARQVILNLAQNAFDAMPANGVLTITTEHSYPHAVLRIKDTGHGIPPEIMAKVGTPFFTTKERGTGLGLPVCFRILEKYDAQAAIDSSELGTTVTITFPTEQSNSTNKGPH